ncbi:MAG: SDR family NAD(P)-dependent oxidoreductase [Rhodanobacter sp.]|jgi:NAD(P)-dependent dehydrogenase (short-subunit alcohol dehydrogenase family)|nr:SDR family NAD(P)-dependent oxidoreductase [Rhodanobacter sp.]
MHLENQRIAVTGAFGTLGAAVVRAACSAGAKVAAIGHAAAPSSALPSTAIAILGTDLADTAAAQQALDQAAQALGGLDALVNIAGAFRWETLTDGDPDTWDFLYRANLRTAVAASQAAIAHLQRNGGGRIVNIGAAGATKAAAGMGAYAASKAGIARLTEALAEELKDHRITVNAVLPSIIDTPSNRAAMPDAPFDRWVTPEQVSAVILFLLCAQASAVTGALLPVTGRL